MFHLTKQVSKCKLHSILYISLIGILIWTSCTIHVLFVQLSVRYVSFDTDVSIQRKRVHRNINYFVFELTSFVIMLLYVDICTISILLMEFNPSIYKVFSICSQLSLYPRVNVNGILLVTFLTLIVIHEPPLLYHANWETDPFKLLVSSSFNDFPFWVSLLALILSNDVELNPGDHLNKGFLSFCNWNINSLSKMILNEYPFLKLTPSLNTT